nr:hypothetical protein [Tanacetum cinerariifolium]
MLRACVLDFGGSYDVHLLLMEFSYNNSYHSSVRCASFEALYCRKCRSPIMWAEVGEGQLIGPELMQDTTKKISQIKDRVKGVVCFGKKGKLAPRFIRPFEITEWIGLVANRLRFPKELNEPVEILEREFKKLKRSRIAIVKVRWNSKLGPEFTWEREDQMKLNYVFASPVSDRGNIIRRTDSFSKTVAFTDEGSSNFDTYKIMARMDAMAIKMDAQYKKLQSRTKQPTPDLDDDAIPMSREEVAKFMQTFRKTRFYNDYRDRDLNGDNWRSSGRNDYNQDNYRCNTDDKSYDLQRQFNDFMKS